MLLDTNILSELMRACPNPAIIEWLDRQPADQLFVSAISRAEIELGIALLPEGKRQNELRSAAEDMFAVFAGKIFHLMSWQRSSTAFSLRKEYG